MIPILYKSDEVDFYDNGLGALTEIYDVDVQEQRNGLFTLTATYPVSGQRYKDIEVGRIIYAKPNQNDDPQAFRIVHTELDISGYNLTIEADHITYDLTHNMVKKVHLQGDGQNAMTALQNATTAPHMFRFVSDLQHIGDSTLKYVNPMEAIAGTQGSILQIWGGELKRGNRTVSMLSRRGRDNFTTFRLGKNINGLKYTVDTSNLVTRIIPTITQTNAVNKEYFIAGDSVDSTNIQKYPNVYIQHVDMGDEVKVEENESEDSIKAKINAKAKNWFTQSANTHVDLPQITVEIDVTSLQDSADYQDEFKNLEAIELTDTVTVYVPEFGVNVQAIVNELHFDPMTERVTSIVVGTSKTSFVDANANQFSALENKINQIRQDAVTAIVSSNGKNTNYYSNKEPEHPVEGDLWFKQVGDDMYIMVFKDGKWVELVSTRTQEMIDKAVEDVIKKAQEYADELNDKQAKEYQEFREKYDKELDDAKTERDALDKKISDIDTETAQKLVEASEDRKRIEEKATQLITDANDHAQELADNAVSTAKAEASKALTSANQALDEAKTDLGGKINDVHSETVKNATEISGKVSQSDFDAKTGDLTTKYGQVKATADAVTTDVANYKKSNDSKVSANTANITANAKAIALKVSQTDFDSTTKDVNTKIANQKITVDKISDSVTELQAKANAQGQVNQLMNTEFTPDLQGWLVDSTDGKHDPYRSYLDKNVKATTVGFYTLNADTSKGSYFSRFYQSVPLGTAGNGYLSLSWQSYLPEMADGMYGHIWIKFHDKDGNAVYNSTGSNPMGNWISKGQVNWQRQKMENIEIPQTATEVTISFETREGIRAYLARPMLVFDDHIGDYAPGQYNNNARVSALEVSLNGITQTVQDPKNGLSATNKLASDGNTLAIKAQKDATTAITTAQGIQTQVNSNDGDIKSLQSTMTQTAKQITTEVEDRKSGDSAVETRMKDLMNTQITSVTKGYTSLNSQTEQSFKTQIKNVSDKLNDLGQINLLKNSEFNPDLEGWYTTTSGTIKEPYRSYWQPDTQATTVGWATQSGSTSSYSRLRQDVQLSSTPGSGHQISISWYAYTGQTDFYNNLWVTFYDKDNKSVGNKIYKWATTDGTNPSKQNSWNVQNKWEGIDVPDTAVMVNVSFEAREGTSAYLAHPMLVMGPTIGSYTPGNYNNNNLVESTRVQLDNLIKDQITNVKDQISTTKTQTDKQITNEVSDRKNGDSTLNTQLRNYIGTQVSSVTSGYQSAIEQSADMVMASVSTPNLLLNTNFTPDLENWDINQKGGTTNDTFYRSIIDDQGHTAVGVNIPDSAGSDANKHYAYLEQDIQMPGWKNNVKLSLSWRIQVRHMLNYAWLWIQFLDSNKAHMLKADGSQKNVGYNYGATGNNADGRWHDGKLENIAVPDGCVYIRVSFQAREGTQLYMTQPMATFTSKAQSYMPGNYSGMNTSTVLKLAKDNWALGITDNAGRIISGINGDTSGTLIQGKRLIINSDTTINGKAFIDGSVIKNASIGQAQIGNASVGNAQIINLDVAKLSGNIANFITGNIKTLNSHVLYGDTGHLGTTDTGRVINKQDNHLQLAAKGFYDSTNDRAQLELLGNSDSHISDDMKGSLNYYGNPTDKGHGLGIRMKYNQILAIDEDRGSKMLYLSPYQGGEVRVVSRDLQAYYPMRASSFNAMSSRSAKSNIVPFEDCALDIVKKTKVRTYIKNNKQEIGVISDEADPRMLTDDDNAVSLYDYTSILYKAVQELTAKVEELENGKS
ncbi:phage tail spike protein [Weissella paramesenteroides]|uniref:phage tail spike protein n=1 Tax=Weissella paramesenteroides TaxID=1249 RepID=UPI003981DF3F